jgi:hypothetical protein
MLFDLVSTQQAQQSCLRRDQRPYAADPDWRILISMVVAVQTPVTVLDDRRTDWVRQYRHDQAAADLWAKGLRQVSHSLQTQERVFRMTEQLARTGVDRTDVFTALEEADRCVALSDNPHAAAEAGHRAISTLVSLAPESLVICADEDESSLRAQGFDPLTFDGHDPAAYAWVMFELSKRAEADRRSNWRRGVPQDLSTPTAIGLALL